MKNSTLKKNEFIWPNIDNNYLNELGTCYALKDQLAILVDGTVVPCCLDSNGVINLGNIYKQDLEEIIRLYDEVNWKTEGVSITFKNSLNDSREKIDEALNEVIVTINEQVNNLDRSLEETDKTGSTDATNK